MNRRGRMGGGALGFGRIYTVSLVLASVIAWALRSRPRSRAVTQSILGTLLCSTRKKVPVSKEKRLSDYIQLLTISMSRTCTRRARTEVKIFGDFL